MLLAWLLQVFCFFYIATSIPTPNKGVITFSLKRIQLYTDMFLKAITSCYLLIHTRVQDPFTFLFFAFPSQFELSRRPFRLWRHTNRRSHWYVTVSVIHFYWWCKRNRWAEASAPFPARLILSLLPQLMGRSKCQRREPGGFYHGRRPLHPDPHSEPGRETRSIQLSIETVNLRGSSLLQLIMSLYRNTGQVRTTLYCNMNCLFLVLLWNGVMWPLTKTKEQTRFSIFWLLNIEQDLK